MFKINFIVLLFLSAFCVSQNKIEAEKLVEEGIPYHDKGDFEGAINKYDKALELDAFNIYALSEKAFSLNSFNKSEDAITVCKLAIEKHPKDILLKSIYVSYGNALDEQKKTDKSLEIYDEGIKLFPDYFLLFYNKGITLTSIKKNDEGIKCLQQAVKLNPKHSSSYNAIARLEKNRNNRIPSILSFLRFLIIEPQTKRAKENLESLKELLNQGVKKTGENSITLNVDSNDLDGFTSKEKKENNFKSTNLTLSMSSALDYDDKNKNETEIENLIRKVQTICSSLSETKKANYGFYWEYLAPYFIEMNNKNVLTPFAYIVNASSEKDYIKDWIKNDKTELDKFYNWSKEYKWNSIK